MDSLTTYSLYGLLALIYIILLMHKRNEVSAILAVAFSVTAFAIRRSIDVDSVHDFAPYFASFLQVKTGTIPSELLIEPYRVVLFKFFLLFNGLDEMAAMNLIYYFHFAVVTSFFVWLAYSEKVSFEASLILFLAFYPTIAFVWIRSGMAIAAAAVLVVVSTNRKVRVMQWLLPLLHASVVPLVVALKTKNMAPIRRTVILVIAAGIGLYLIESSYAQYLFNKWDRYSSTSDRRESRNLLVFHVINVVAFSYFAAINSRLRRSYVVLVLMGTYLALFFVSPIMGLRIFPFVLIGIIGERITFPRHRVMSMIVCLAYLPIFFSRFEQIVSG